MTSAQPIALPAQAFDPEAALRHGFALHRSGDLAEAERQYRAVLKAAPHEHRALTLLAPLLEGQGLIDAAHDACATALRLAPQAPAPRLQLARLLIGKGDAAGALAVIRPFTAAMPNEPKGWMLRGRAAALLNEQDEAASSFEQAEAKGDPTAAAHLGKALQALGRNEAAVAAYRRALAHAPRHTPGHATLLGALGNALSALGQRDAAIASYRDAIAIDPNLHDAYGALGVELQALGQYEAAATAYLGGLAVAPDRGDVLNNLASCRLDQGRPRWAQATYKALIAREPGHATARRNLCLATAYDDGNSAEDLAAVCRAAVADLAIADRPSKRPRGPGEPLRIGFVSADLRSHSVGAFVEPLFAHFDPNRIALHAYANIAQPDAVTDRLKRLASGWRDTAAWTAEETAAAIRADGIDILVDLAGHTGDTRLDVFALRPAAIQASWLGWPSTTGLAAIDFKLSDALLTPPGSAEPMVETPIVLAGPALCFRPPDDAAAVAPLPALANGHVTFGSFNRIAKTSPRTLRLWAEILTALPDARLLLKDNGFRCAAAVAHFERRLQAAGIDPARATLMGSTATKAEHLALYGQVDIALDSMPYNGVTTTCEALWMGVPTVTLAGGQSLSRYGLTVMTHAGFPDLAAADGSGYVAQALALARDPQPLAAIRGVMRRRLRQSRLLDGKAFAADFADACAAMDRQIGS